MTTPDLGPLPEPTCIAVIVDKDGVPLPESAYTADQMRAYVAQEVVAERERCAKVADEHARRDYPWGSENADLYHAQADWAAKIAEAIREGQP